MKQCSRTLIVGNERGLHSRIATHLAAIAAEYRVKLVVSNGTESADCSMILDVLALGVGHGATLHVRATGEQAGSVLLLVEQVLTTQDDPI
ncbi:HPr family phosphocarrier protein [Desulfobulbus propionicus]